VTRRPRGTARVRPGHTLVEMVAALAIIGIAASAVAPAWRGARDARDDDAGRAARSVVRLLEGARATAARRGEVVTLAIDATSARAWLTTGDGMPVDAGAVDLGAAGVLATIAPATDAGRARFVFTPAGMAFGDALVVRDGVRALRVHVDPWTGEAHVEPR